MSTSFNLMSEPTHDNGKLILNCHTVHRSADYNDFLGIQEDLLLQLLAVVESTGTALAVPTQLTHIVYEWDAEPRRQDEKAVTPWASVGAGTLRNLAPALF